MDDKHRKDVTKLSQLSGAEFDRAYAKMMLSDHKKDVSEFEKHSTRGTDADLRAFASRTLPTLREHLEMTRTLPGNAGTDNRNNNTRSTNRNMNDNDNTTRNANGNANSNRNRNSNGNGNSNRNNNGNSNNSNRP
jgi:hypothetical protein